MFVSGRGYAFPCDGNGRVDLDQLSERARINYLYARAMVGRELSVPAVEAADTTVTADLETGPPVNVMIRPSGSTESARAAG